MPELLTLVSCEFLEGNLVFGVKTYFCASILDCRTWRWYSMLLTDESLPLGTAAAATGRLASFAPSTLTPVLPVVEDMIVLS